MRLGSRVSTLLLLSVFGALTAISQPARAITMLPGSNESSYAELAQQPQYVSVGRIDGSTANSNFLASGTLIDPSWVLTAAHVVDDANKLTFSIGGETYTADRMYTPQQWNGDLWAGYDIGLVHLSAPVDNVKPAARYTGDQEWHKAETYVGYGMTGNGNTGATKLDGVKRAAQNIVDQMPNSRLMTSEFSKVRGEGVAATLPLEGLIAPGDSGGGMFINTPYGTVLAGVNSFVASLDGSKPNSGFGDIAGDTRVSAFNAWIDSVMKGSGAATEIHPTMLTGPSATSANVCPVSAPSSPAAVPEPGTFVLSASALLLGAVFAARRRMK